jgi:uncharacterized protein (DUF983 family)
MSQNTPSLPSQKLSKQDFTRSMRSKCPACGEGAMFSSYLKVVNACGACGEELHHHRADDLPAYIVILIVGHFVVLGAMELEVSLAPPLWVHAVLWLPFILIGSLLLLPPIKSLIVTLQWRMGMHGFRKNKSA